MIPTNELRYCVKQALDFRPDAYLTVLQQKWVAEEIPAGATELPLFEWRDVPTVYPPHN